MIVQSSNYSSKRYYGPIHGLAAATAEEKGGYGALYAWEHVLPTILIRGVSVLIRSLSGHFISNDLGIYPDFSPLLYKLATLVMMGLEVAVITPFEMARKRIQVQTLRATRNCKIQNKNVNQGGLGGLDRAQPFESCINMSPRVYSGILSAIYGIIAEEGSTLKRRHRKKKQKFMHTVDSSISPEALSSSYYSNERTAVDWQDLYNGNGNAKRQDNSRKTGGLSHKFGKYWLGVKTLYRGYWARYTIEIVKFAFSEIRDSNDDLF